MIITRLKNKLLFGAVAISLLVALASMLAVSLVVSRQQTEQSNALLKKAFRIVDNKLAERKNNLVNASRQLASQKNLGSTIWYLGQYARSVADRATLFNTYRQLAQDTRRTGRIAEASRIAIYDSAGLLVSFASFGREGEVAGFVERSPEPLFQVARLKDGEEFGSQNLRTAKTFQGIGPDFSGPLPQRETVRYTVADGALAIESLTPIIGDAFDLKTGKQETRQLGLVAIVQLLDQAFVDDLASITDTKIDLFTQQGFSHGSVADYREPDWTKARPATDAHGPPISFNEIAISGTRYYQGLMPLRADKELVGTIAVLYSKEIVTRNTWEMIHILGVIAAAVPLLIFPFAWFFATTISGPIATLSRIFRSVGDEQTAPLDDELRYLQRESERPDELGDLAKSFMIMHQAVNQKIQQINDINASLEHEVEQRTRELRRANENLTKLATYDTLTGLPNRKLLAELLPRAIATAKRRGERMALLFIDLDEFKPINDTYGHETGDKLLVEAASRIHGTIRDSDTAARIGGDEFVVVLRIIESTHDAQAVAEKICRTLNHPFDLAGKSLHISSSIGIALFPDHGADVRTLLQNADTAMYFAKESGRNRVKLFVEGEMGARGEVEG